MASRSNSRGAGWSLVARDLSGPAGGRMAASAGPGPSMVRTGVGPPASPPPRSGIANQATAPQTTTAKAKQVASTVARPPGTRSNFRFIGAAAKSGRSGLQLFYSTVAVFAAGHLTYAPVHEVASEQQDGDSNRDTDRTEVVRDVLPVLAEHISGPGEA